MATAEWQQQQSLLRWRCCAAFARFARGRLGPGGLRAVLIWLSRPARAELAGPDESRRGTTDFVSRALCWRVERIGQIVGGIQGAVRSAGW